MPIQHTPPKDKNRAQKMKAFDRLLTIMDELRLNCPWDKKQTLESIRYLTIEEVYELSDAIINQDIDEVKNELGDIMLHLVFYSKIASETGRFDIADVLDGVCEKMIRRHPHIYGDAVASDEATVKRNWERIKLSEKKGKSVLEGVPTSLPAMTKATRIQEKARGIGFDWNNSKDVLQKVKEEIEEFETEITPAEKEKEFGDILFSLINYARFIGIDPEQALEKTNKKFIHRFQHIEKRAKEEELDLKKMSLGQMDVFWNEAKKL